jgi:hypothetical protein
MLVTCEEAAEMLSIDSEHDFGLAVLPYIGHVFLKGMDKNYGLVPVAELERFIAESMSSPIISVIRKHEVRLQDEAGQMVNNILPGSREAVAE